MQETSGAASSTFATQVFLLLAAALLGLGGSARAGTEGLSSTFYGSGAGSTQYYGVGADNLSNTFIGESAGFDNTTGFANTFVGRRAGHLNVTANGNTAVGYDAGHYTTNERNSFFGYLAGYTNSTGYYNTYVGSEAGYSGTTGQFNAMLGIISGYSNTTGSFNTYLGSQAGQNNVSGSNNVFIGNAAGYTETGSNRLYIDNCMNGNPCTPPFIYGEFDNHLLKINGVLHVAADGATNSQLHFSLNNLDVGGWLTSVLDNNFFMSSGARYAGGQWYQRSSDGQSVIQGSGSLGYRIFTSSGHPAGTTFSPIARLHIDYNGQFGINTAPFGGHEIHTATGAYEAGGTWVNGSSRDYKHDIRELSGGEAAAVVAVLNPVKFRYNGDDDQQHVGFIAEDVPELVAMKDRRGLSPMDILAVLTKVVQEERERIAAQEQKLQAERSSRESLEERLQRLAAEVAQLRTRTQEASNEQQP
jgi:hypothetical protein